MESRKTKIISVVAIVALLLIVFGIGVGVTLLYMNNKYKVYEEEEPKQIKKHVDTISMMLETEAGSGNYEMTTASSWPTDGYVFNTELSKCENGGELSWDDANKTVLMSGNVSDKCYVYFDKYNSITINNNSITSNGNSITITIDATAGTGTIAKYLYSKDNGVSYVQSANNTYTFTGLDKGTYNIKAYVQDSNGKNSEIISKTIEITSITLADYVKSLYTGTQGNNGIYYHDANLTNGAGDSSYRYSGANPNNYVCFGTNTTPCPTDNLYRIIGVFGNNVKLIKYDYATSALLGTDGDYKGTGTPNASYYKGSLTTINTYYWNNSTKKNTWSESLLNKTNLNTNFINNIGTEWANKIATTTWKVGGNTYANIRDVIPATAYQNEIVNPVTTNTTDNATEYSAKIGLMYVSDYGFGADPSAWTTTLYNYDGSVNGSTIRSLNWMHMGYYDWTLSRDADYSNYAFSVHLGGYVNDYNVYGNYVHSSIAVRPSFNLESSITYVSGSGSASDPMVIN